MFEALLLEKLLGLRAHAVGQQCDAFEIFLFSEVHDVIDQHCAIALAAVVRVDDVLDCPAITPT